MTLYRNVVFALTIPFAACGGNKEPAQPAPPPTDAVAGITLADDPGQALGVAAAKAKGVQDAVVVEGRVCDVTKGFAVLKLMDKSLDYCGEVNKEDECKTPWDYCCDTPDDRAANSLLVEFRGDDGQPLATPSLPDTRLCDHVKVRGALTKDEHGNFVVVADGIFRVERPELPDYIEWPQ